MGFDQGAEGFAVGGQGQAQAGELFGEQAGGGGGALGLGVELLVELAGDLGKGLGAAEQVGQLAGKVGAGNADVEHLLAQHVQHGVDGGQRGGQALQGLGGGFAFAQEGGAGAGDDAIDFLEVGFGDGFHGVAVTHVDRARALDGFAHGGRGAQRQGGQLFADRVELALPGGLDLLGLEALGGDAHALAEVFDGIAGNAQGGGQVAHVVADAREGARQAVGHLLVERGAVGLGAGEQPAAPVLELVAAEAVGAEGALDAGVLEAPAQQGDDGDGGQCVRGDGAHADAQAGAHAAGGHGRAGGRQRHAGVAGQRHGRAGAGQAAEAAGQLQAAADEAQAAHATAATAAGGRRGASGQAQAGADGAHHGVHHGLDDGAQHHRLEQVLDEIAGLHGAGHQRVGQALADLRGDLLPVARGGLRGVAVGVARGAAAHELEQPFAGRDFAVDGLGAGVVGVQSDGLLLQPGDGHALDGFGQADVLRGGQGDGLLFGLQVGQAPLDAGGAGGGGVDAALHDGLDEAAVGLGLAVQAGDALGFLLAQRDGEVGLGLDARVDLALALRGKLARGEVAEGVGGGGVDGWGGRPVAGRCGCRCCGGGQRGGCCAAGVQYSLL